jgi:hypothetical protein
MSDFKNVIKRVVQHVITRVHKTTQKFIFSTIETGIGTVIGLKRQGLNHEYHEYKERTIGQFRP